jgi:hypothetical protein
VGNVLGWREFGMEGHCPEKRVLERKWGKRRKSGGGLWSGLNVGRRAFIQGVHVGLRVGTCCGSAEVHKMVFEETEQEDIPTIIDSGRLVVGSRSDC